MPTDFQTETCQNTADRQHNVLSPGTNTVSELQRETKCDLNEYKRFNDNGQQDIKNRCITQYHMTMVIKTSKQTICQSKIKNRNSSKLQQPLQYHREKQTIISPNKEDTTKMESRTLRIVKMISNLPSM